MGNGSSLLFYNEPFFRHVFSTSFPPPKKRVKGRGGGLSRKGLSSPPHLPHTPTSNFPIFFAIFSAAAAAAVVVAAAVKEAAVAAIKKRIFVSWDAHIAYHGFCTFGQSLLINKISALELTRKFINGPLSVGSFQSRPTHT